MQTYRKGFFLFISFFVWIGCQAPSYARKAGKFDRDCFKRFVPDFRTQWYKATIDVTGKHFSGLLLFKSFGDSVTRVVFTSEAGTTFFDFEFGARRNKVNFILPQINKGPVIRTLQNDLYLVLMRYERDPKATLLVDQDSKYLQVPRGRKTIYLVTSDDCQHLKSIREEWGGKKKVEVTLGGYTAGVPDSISITHFNFNMQINLRKLQQ